MCYRDELLLYYTLMYTVSTAFSPGRSSCTVPGTALESSLYRWWWTADSRTAQLKEPAPRSTLLWRHRSRIIVATAENARRAMGCGRARAKVHRGGHHKRRKLGRLVEGNTKKRVAAFHPSEGRPSEGAFHRRRRCTIFPLRKLALIVGDGQMILILDGLWI